MRRREASRSSSSPFQPAVQLWAIRLAKPSPFSARLRSVGRADALSIATDRIAITPSSPRSVA